MYTQDEHTLISSVHFLVYFVAVPGEKVIIIHSINHPIFIKLHVKIMTFMNLLIVFSRGYLYM